MGRRQSLYFSRQAGRKTSCCLHLPTRRRIINYGGAGSPTISADPLRYGSRFWTLWLPVRCQSQGRGSPRTIVLGITPSELEDEIVEKAYDPLTQTHRPEFKTYENVIRWCKMRVTQKRAKELSEFARKPPVSQIKMLRNEEGQPSRRRSGPEQIPSWAKDIVAAIRGGLGAGPQPVTQDKAEVPPPPEPALNAVRPSPKPKAKARSFSFKGCWHCGVEGHSRSACEEFKKLMANHNRVSPTSQSGNSQWVTSASTRLRRRKLRKPE